MDDAVDRTLRQTWAFVFRGYHLTRRYISWVIVFNFYALTGSAAVALIGVAAHDHQLTLTLVVGALLWNFLSVLYNEIAMSVAYERWEGTLEYTFMAPVPRLVHLAGLSLFALCNSIVNTAAVLGGLMLFTDLTLSGANLAGVMAVLLVSTVAFVGLGVMAAALPVLSPERGAEATHIFQGSLLLVSGVYYPVDVLPPWLRPLSALSPATYTLAACRRLVGVGDPRDDAAATGRRIPLGSASRPHRPGSHGRRAGAAGPLGLRPRRTVGKTHGTAQANWMTPASPKSRRPASRRGLPTSAAARQRGCSCPERTRGPASPGPDAP